MKCVGVRCTGGWAEAERAAHDACKHLTYVAGQGRHLRNYGGPRIGAPRSCTFGFLDIDEIHVIDGRYHFIAITGHAYSAPRFSRAK